MTGRTIARPARAEDAGGIWRVLEPSIREGIWFPIPAEYDADEGLAFWGADRHEVYVGERDGEIVWTYYLTPFQLGGGSHVANAGLAVSPDRFGEGLGREMVESALAQARRSGYLAMIFATVLATNERALRLYHHAGFVDIGTVPNGYRHPTLGFVDTIVMHRAL